MFSWKGQSVAITGATGFVGYHTALELSRHGAEVVALVRATSDVRRLVAAGVPNRTVVLDDASALALALAGRQIVVHCAAAVGFGTDWAGYYRANVQGTQILLDACRQAGVRRFVHTSSVSTVGATGTRKILDETAVWNLKSRRVPYVTTKRWAENVALAGNGRDLEVVVVNPGSVLGPEDYSRSEFGTLCNRVWKGRLPFYFGGGNNFVDVRDVALGIRLACEGGHPGERYLLVGENRSYPEFFADLARTAQQKVRCFRLPITLAPLIGTLNDWLSWRTSKRPYFSSAQAALVGLYFYFDGGKARRELGFTARPLRQTLADSHAFWMGARPPVGSVRSKRAA